MTKVVEVAKLQEFLSRQNLTQESLAQKIGVKRGTIAQWNTGRTDITRENCGKLLAEGMSLEELFGDEVALIVRKEILNSVDVTKNQSSSVLNLISGLEQILMSAKITEANRKG